MDLDELRSRSDLLSNSATKNVVRALLKQKQKEKSQQRTEELFKSRARKCELLQKRHQNFLVSESTPGDSLQTNDEIVNSSPHFTVLPDHPDDTLGMTIQDVLARPVLIDDFTIALETEVLRSINPWDLWAADSLVRAKLRNFAYMSGTLCLRFILSSSKYHYGSVMFSYQPYPESNQVLLTLEEDAITNGQLMIRNYLSQSPQRANIKLGADNSMEMRLPMLIPKQKVRLYNTANEVIQGADSYLELALLGEIYMITNNVIRSASEEVGTSVKLQTYAWMEDLQLSGLTATDIDIVSESTPMANMSVPISGNPVLRMAANAAASLANDEYSPNNGSSVSTVFSAISNVGEKLSDIPIIGKAARATSFVTGGLAKLAKMFGFSKPAQIEEVKFAKNLVSDNMANASGFSTVHKLTIDPKQELAVSFYDGNSDIDPMSIKAICSRESLLHSFTWAPTNVPRVDSLFISPVSPLLSTIGIGNIGQPSAMAWVAHQFQHWRGSIFFRFEVIASSFHRGKLMFIYEPNVNANGLILSSPTNVNKQYIYYLDIEEARDLTVECGFLFDRMFCKVVNEDDSVRGYTTQSYGAGGAATNRIQHAEICNIGMLYVRPFTTLSGPSSSPNVEVNVYVYSDNLELARPVQYAEPSRLIAESQPRNDTAKGGIQIENQGISRTSDSYVLINKTALKNDDIYLHHFGEKIESLRTLLKRSMLTNAASTDAVGETENGDLVLRFPLYPPAFQDALPGIGTLNNLNVARHAFSFLPNYFTELRLAFLFMKGGYRHKVSIIKDPTDQEMIISACLEVASDVRDTLGWQKRIISDIESYQESDIRNQGGMLFDTRVNGLVDVEVPYYSTNLYELATQCYPYTTDPFDQMFQRDTPVLVVKMERVGDPDKERFFKQYTSAAEDFTFFHFQGAPFFDRLNNS